MFKRRKPGHKLVTPTAKIGSTLLRNGRRHECAALENGKAFRRTLKTVVR